MIERVGVLFHPKRADAHAAAREAVKVLSQCGVTCSLLPAWDEEAIRAALPAWQMVITCGGDGTILRTTRLAAPLGVPQVGINLGRLGFLAELQPAEVAERLPSYLTGQYPIEERAMLRAILYQAGEPLPEASAEETATHRFDALNEVLVTRGALPRMITVRVTVDGVDYNTFAGDGVLVATATGSTAYCMSAGGPVLAPSLRSVILQPVCPHVARPTALVLPPESQVILEVGAGFPAILSIDGQVDLALGDGDRVHVSLSPYTARFVRARPLEHFYQLVRRVLH